MANPANPGTPRQRKPQAPAPDTPPVSPAGPPPPPDTTTLGTAFVGAVKGTVAAAVLEKRPYLKYAFANPYNISLFLGALAAAGLTLNPVLAV